MTKNPLCDKDKSCSESNMAKYTAASIVGEIADMHVFVVRQRILQKLFDLNVTMLHSFRSDFFEYFSYKTLVCKLFSRKMMP